MEFLHYIHDILGIDSQQLTLSHLIMRSLIVYAVGIGLGRINRKFIGIRTISNFFLFIFIGSLLAAAILGPLFYEILSLVIFVMIFNWIINVLSYYITSFKTIITGHPILLIDGGEIQAKGLKKSFITENELYSLLRIKTNTSDISKVDKAYLENSGQISFTMK